MNLSFILSHQVHSLATNFHIRESTKYTSSSRSALSNSSNAMGRNIHRGRSGNGTRTGNSTARTKKRNSGTSRTDSSGESRTHITIVECSVKDQSQSQPQANIQGKLQTNDQTNARTNTKANAQTDTDVNPQTSKVLREKYDLIQQRLAALKIKQMELSLQSDQKQSPSPPPSTSQQQQYQQQQYQQHQEQPQQEKQANIQFQDGNLPVRKQRDRDLHPPKSSSGSTRKKSSTRRQPSQDGLHDHQPQIPSQTSPLPQHSFHTSSVVDSSQSRSAHKVTFTEVDEYSLQPQVDSSLYPQTQRRHSYQFPSAEPKQSKQQVSPELTLEYSARSIPPKTGCTSSEADNDVIHHENYGYGDGNGEGDEEAQNPFCRFTMDQDPSTIDPVIAPAYVKYLGTRGLWMEALDFYRSVDKPSTDLCNATLKACAAHARWRETVSILQQMETNNIECDVNTFAACMKAFAKAGKWKKGWILLEHMKRRNAYVMSNHNRHGKSGILTKNSSSSPTSNSKLKKKVNQVSKVKVNNNNVDFDVDADADDVDAGPDEEMDLNSQSSPALSNHSLKHLTPVKPNVIIYNWLIIACDRAGQSELAYELFEEMKREGISPDQLSYSVVLGSCAFRKKPSLAWKILLEMKQKGLEPDCISYTECIRAYHQVGNWEKALDVYDQMQHDRVAPSVVTYNVVLTVCKHLKDWQTALELLNQLKIENPSLLNKFTYTTAISACAAAAKSNIAIDLLSEMKRSNIHPDRFTYNAALSACANENRSKDALRLLDMMENEDQINPDKVSFQVAILACRTTNDFSSALEILDRLYASNVRPNIAIYKAAISVFENAGKVDEVEKLKLKIQEILNVRRKNSRLYR